MNNKNKEGNNFLKHIVVIVLVSMPVFAAIFVILQLTTDLDPSPYLGYLALPGAVELVLTAALKSVERLKSGNSHNEDECNDDSDQIGFDNGLG